LKCLADPISYLIDLHKAIQWRDINFARFLVQEGASITFVNGSGDTALLAIDDKDPTDFMRIYRTFG
jgi:hypothetical protein